MSLTPAQAQQLDRLATDALDALRDQDRAAVNAATELHDQAGARAELARRVAIAERAELRLIDAIHALVRHTPEPAPDRSWLLPAEPGRGPWWPPAAPLRRLTGHRNL
jgi:hypothetical protein